MAKFTDLIRSNDWWAYKIPPILTVAFIIVLHSEYTIVDMYGAFIIAMVALVIGAAYVSILNDATDVAEDAAVGKRNSMASFSVPMRVAIVLLPVAMAICVVLLFFKSSFITTVFYVVSYICFTLYSLPPFRFKERGFAGVLADALGSQVFPTLFVASFFLAKTSEQMAVAPLMCIGGLALGFGLRGIIWHQFHDLKNDMQSGLRTIAGKLSDFQVRILGQSLIALEITALILLSIYYRLSSVFVGLAIYAAYLYLLKRKWQIVPILIKPRETRYRIFMSEFYQVYLPTCILTQCIIRNRIDVIALVVYLILFPLISVRLLKEWVRLLRQVIVDQHRASAKRLG
jgi:4-hydroxybenzoate polyprenyltransferase